jgi:integrase
MSSPAPFTLCRIQRNERIYYYALFRDPVTGKRTNKKSVERLRTRLGILSEQPIRRRDEAIRICQQALEAGLIFSRNTKIGLKAYLRSFYTWDESEYVKRRNMLSAGSIGQDYIETRLNLLENHVLKEIQPNMLLSEVTLGWLEAVQYRLATGNTISHATVNIIMGAVVTAVKDAQRRGDISSLVSLELKHLDVVHRSRGILTEQELATFMNWAQVNSERRIYLACLLALVTGMRSGELRGLLVQAVGNDMITVDTAYADRAGLKMPKGKRTRYVPCPPPLCAELCMLAAENPYSSEHQLVFWSKRGGGFVSSHYFSTRFKEELVRSEVLSQEQVEKRNITFHSLRHMANTLLRGRVDEYLLRMTIGHTKTQLSDLYTHMNRRSLDEVARAQQQAILSLLEESTPTLEDTP